MISLAPPTSFSVEGTRVSHTSAARQGEKRNANGQCQTWTSSREEEEGGERPHQPRQRRGSEQRNATVSASRLIRGKRTGAHKVRSKSTSHRTSEKSARAAPSWNAEGAKAAHVQSPSPSSLWRQSKRKAHHSHGESMEEGG